MALEHVQWLTVDGFWRFRVTDRGDTIALDVVADEAGEFSHLTATFPATEFIAGLRDLGAHMPDPKDDD